MFDWVKCDYPLPWPEAADFGFDWQSKDTDAQYCDRYEIRADGTLWHENYDARWEKDTHAILGVYRYRDNIRWEQVQCTGKIEIHHWVEDVGMYSVSFWFRDGVVRKAVFDKQEKDWTPSTGTKPTPGSMNTKPERKTRCKPN